MRRPPRIRTCKTKEAAGLNKKAAELTTDIAVKPTSKIVSVLPMKKLKKR